MSRVVTGSLSRLMAVFLFVSVVGNAFPTSLVATAGAASLPPYPTALPRTMFLGLDNNTKKRQPNVGIQWMIDSHIPWDTRGTFLSGGVNTSSNWTTWASPAGAYASKYMQESAGGNYLPVFDYYELLGSLPAVGTTEKQKVTSNLMNTSTMNAYYANWQLLLNLAHTFGKPVIVHHEPDAWGYIKAVYGTDATQAPAAVASSGYADAASYPNTVAGFAQTLVHMRDLYAPNVILAWDIAPWEAGRNVSISKTAFDVAAAAQAVSTFYLSLGAKFDLMFYRAADRDAAYMQYVGLDGGASWWDPTNLTLPNFTRFAEWTGDITIDTGVRGVLWHLPVGNQVFDTENNTTGHYQDNRVQYFLGASWQAHLAQFANAGIVGMMFGHGKAETTDYTDFQGDGITNPAPINGNTAVSTVADDDGGYLRQQAAAYYLNGRLPLP